MGLEEKKNKNSLNIKRFSSRRQKTLNAYKRREGILQLLKQEKTALSASAIAAKFGVSRQIIVGDVALLRAAGACILATPRGYILDVGREGQGYEGTLVCCHLQDRLQEEIYTIVDCGGALLDITVEHAVYGEIVGQLQIYSRYDADIFMEKLRQSDAAPLALLTGGVHLHKIRCKDEAAFLRVRQALREKGILFEEH